MKVLKCLLIIDRKEAVAMKSKIFLTAKTKVELRDESNGDIAF